MAETQVLIVGAAGRSDSRADSANGACLHSHRAQTKLNSASEDERCKPDMEIYSPAGDRGKSSRRRSARSAPMDAFSQPRWRPPLPPPCPSVDEAKAEIAAHNDGRPLERIN